MSSHIDPSTSEPCAYLRRQGEPPPKPKVKPPIDRSDPANYRDLTREEKRARANKPRIEEPKIVTFGEQLQNCRDGIERNRRIESERPRTVY